MKPVLIDIQDKNKAKDTVEVVKALKIVPAKKIKSEDGAIIPKEAVSWTVLEPSIPIEKPKDSEFTTYAVIGLVLVGTLILIKYILNKRKKTF